MRLLFAGTPEAAAPSLRALLKSRHEVVAVLTRPDAREGRGRTLSRSPIGRLADEAGIPVLQPATLRDPDTVAAIREVAPDLCPVVAYGALLPTDVLEIPALGWVNLHFSLLPAWRGAAPVQHAIWHGDDVTGATTFVLDQGMDTGPVLGVVTETIRSTDTSGDLLARLSESGAQLLTATIDGLATGDLVPVPQTNDGVSLAPKIEVADAAVQWHQPALAVDRQIRACTPAPGAWTTLRDQRVKILPVGAVDSTGAEFVRLAPGQLMAQGRTGWLVGTGSDPVLLDRVQPAGKRVMAAADWLRGIRPRSDEVFR